MHAPKDVWLFPQVFNVTVQLYQRLKLYLVTALYIRTVRIAPIK